MFSSVTASQMKGQADGTYWQVNITGPVQYHEALQELILHDTPSGLIEICPSGALKGAISQIPHFLPRDPNPPYCSSQSRRANAAKYLLRWYSPDWRASVDILQSNAYDAHTVHTIVDLPKYS